MRLLGTRNQSKGSETRDSRRGMSRRPRAPAGVSSFSNSLGSTNMRRTLVTKPISPFILAEAGSDVSSEIQCQALFSQRPHILSLPIGSTSCNQHCRLKANLACCGFAMQRWQRQTETVLHACSPQLPHMGCG